MNTRRPAGRARPPKKSEPAIAPDVPARVSLWAHAGLLLLAALAIGLTEAAMVQQGVWGADGPYGYVPPRLWFVLPLCWLALLCVAGIPSVAVARRYGSLIAAGAAILFFVQEHGARGREPGAFGVALVAVPLAAIGLRRFMTRSAASWKRIVVVCLALFLAAAAGAVMTSGPLVHRTAADDREARGPNVLLVVLDTVRHDAIFDADGRVHAYLPAIRRLAAEGVVFDRAYATSGWTIPSHLSVLTGLEGHELGREMRSAEGRAASLMQRYRRLGYRTVGVVANPILGHLGAPELGFDFWAQRLAAFDICRTAPGRRLERFARWFPVGVCRWGASEVTERVIEELEREGPQFVLANYMDAHGPYDVTGECGGSFEGPVYDWPAPRNRPLYAPDYRRAVRCLDQKIAPLLEAARNDPRGTVVVLTADHGEQFGEHGLQTHANSLYPQLLHVPLIVAGGGRTAGRVGEVTSLADVPSILFGLEPRTPGVAQAVLFDTKRRDVVVTVIRGRHQFISWKRGREELYDLTADPAATVDLITSPETAGLAEQLRAEAAAIRSGMADAGAAKFRSLGYIQ